jgi:hypothetical protein
MSGPRFSQAAIEALRHTQGFEEWNRDFEKNKRKVQRRVSPRDIQPLLKAGAKEDRLLTLLAFIVNDSKGEGGLMAKRRSLTKLADELVTVTEHARLIVNDPCCDGRLWLALHCGLPWDLTTQAGVIEAPVLERMKALAELVKQRGDALGVLSRQVKKTLRNRGLFDLLRYVWLQTCRNFDREIAWLLIAAHEALGQDRIFTAAKIKKFRQRHLWQTLDPCKSQPQSETDAATGCKATVRETPAKSATSLPHTVSSSNVGQTVLTTKRKNLGQRLSEALIKDPSFSRSRRDK